MKEPKYIQVITAKGKFIFVKEDDLNEMKKSFNKPFNSKKIIASAFKVMLNSPEGMEAFSNGLNIIHEIYKIEDIEQLDNLIRIIQNQIKAIKHKQRVTEGDLSIPTTQRKMTIKMHISKDNHTIGCELESYVDILMFRGFKKEAEQLDEIASHLK